MITQMSVNIPILWKSVSKKQRWNGTKIRYKALDCGDCVMLPWREISMPSMASIAAIPRTLDIFSKKNSSGKMRGEKKTKQGAPLKGDVGTL